MNLPGENTITLSEAAISQLVEEALNVGQPPAVRVRVTEVDRSSSFSREMTFKVTTDSPPIKQLGE